MIARTSTPQAPWTVVPANDKRLARVSVVESLCTRLQRALNG
jgi:polyphosphate kinase 2 (PPK2 family)